MNQYGDHLLRTAFLLVKDYQLAEEIIQDTFIIAYKKIQQLEDPTKLKSWLTTITINLCRAQFRTWSWKNVFPTFTIFEGTQEDHTVLTPEDELLTLSRNQHISEALQSLDYKYREVLTLFYFNELKIIEIANLIKVKENTVKSRLKRGRLLLKEVLTKGEIVGEGREGTSEKEA